MTSKIAVLRIACTQPAGPEFEYHRGCSTSSVPVPECKYDFHMGFEWVFTNVSMKHDIIVKEEDFRYARIGSSTIFVMLG